MDPPPQMLDEDAPQQGSSSGSKSKAAEAGNTAMIAGGLCCLLGLGVIGGVIAIIVVFAIKAQVSPGVPESCYNLPPSPPGYPAIEVVDAVTADGMTLQLWHVPAETDNSRPVIVMHGLENSARDWFVGLDTDCLPWTLWRNGFDVWVGNSRGTFFSTTPIWNWTFVEMGDYDVPAIVNTVISHTGAASVAWIGHSQGATQAFIHFSESAETSSKISYFGALAPAVFMTQTVLVWNVFSTFYVDEIVAVASARPGTAFTTFEEMQRDRCYVVAWTDSLCLSNCARDMGGSNMMGTSGWEPSCLDKFYCIPAGTSSDNIRAFAESLRLGSFNTYLDNELGRPINFTNLNMPIGLAAGAADLFMSPANVQQLQTECRPGIVQDFWEVPDAGHMDMVWGTEMPQLVYEPMIVKMNAAFR